MVTLRLIMVLVGCFFLLQCRFSGVDKKSLSTQQSPYLLNESDLIGQWKHSNTIWDRESLELHADHTFNYHSSSCLGVLESAGSWSLSFDGIMLTSFERYKKVDTAVKPVYIYKHAVSKKKPKRIQINDSFTIPEFDFIGVEAILVNHDMFNNSKLYFHQELFRKVGNSLVYGGKLKPLQDSRLEKHVSAANTGLPK